MFIRSVYHFSRFIFDYDFEFYVIQFVLSFRGDWFFFACTVGEYFVVFTISYWEGALIVCQLVFRINGVFNQVKHSLEFDNLWGYTHENLLTCLLQQEPNFNRQELPHWKSCRHSRRPISLLQLSFFFFQSKIIKTVLEDVHSSCSNLLRFSFLWTNSLAHLVFFFSYYWSIPICVALCRFLTQIMFLTRYLGRTLLAAARAETSPGPAAAAAIVTGHNPLE